MELCLVAELALVWGVFNLTVESSNHCASVFHRALRLSFFPSFFLSFSPLQEEEERKKQQDEMPGGFPGGFPGGAGGFPGGAAGFPGGTAAGKWRFYQLFLSLCVIKTGRSGSMHGQGHPLGKSIEFF